MLKILNGLPVWLVATERKLDLLLEMMCVMVMNLMRIAMDTIALTTDVQPMKLLVLLVTASNPA